MPSNRALLPTLLTLIVLSLGFAENAAAQVPVRPGSPTAPGTTAKPARQEPCWEVAGVSKAAIQQRRAITQQARQEVEAVCANPSLTAQQKRQEIQQIHQRERQEVDAIITPAQQEAIRSCQQARNAGHGGGHAAGGGGGPCGEMPAGHKPNPQHEEDEAPPEDSPKPN